MIETFCILLMVFYIILFIVKGIGHAGKALCSTPMPKKSTMSTSNHTAGNSASTCNNSISQAFSPEESAKRISEELRQMEQDRKLREEKSWEEFPEKYKGAVCDEEMKAILDLAHKENKTKEEELILLFAKLQVEDLYRKKNAAAKLN